MQRTAPRHFSMVREFHLADFFTLGNAACGVGAILLAMLYMASGDRAHFLAAAALAPAAFIFDVLDGRIARARHQHSALGRELDSLSDVISFGVAPAALALRGGPAGRLGRGGADLLRLLRREPARALQRHRRTAGRRRIGQGEVLRRHADPDQRGAHGRAGAGRRGRATSASASGAAWWTSGPWDLHPLSLLFVLSGSLMISKTLRIPKL